MTSEINQLTNDPNFVVQFAVGEPFPELVPQDRDDTSSGIRLSGVYFDDPKRYLFKKAHLSADDNRIFDTDTGLVVMVSHHFGKNPYESLDPLGVTPIGDSTEQQYSPHGEWECICNVTGQGDGFPSFKIRPKKISRHGTQYIDLEGDDDDVVMNVGKMGKFRSRSMRPHFVVGREKEAPKGDGVAYKVVADMIGRTMSITNSRDELVAQVTKTNKALIKTAVFGSGSESTIDVAPGVDCSTILAIVFGIAQVGKHYVKDAFNNFFMEPLKDQAVDAAVGAATGAVVDAANGEATDIGMGSLVDWAENAGGDALEMLTAEEDENEVFDEGDVSDLEEEQEDEEVEEEEEEEEEEVEEE